MIDVSILYPSGEGKKFDMEYYCNKHMPMVQEKLGDVCKGMAVEQGLGGLFFCRYRFKNETAHFWVWVILRINS